MVIYCIEFKFFYNKRDNRVHNEGQRKCKKETGEQKVQTEQSANGGVEQFKIPGNTFRQAS